MLNIRIHNLPNFVFDPKIFSFESTDFITLRENVGNAAGCSPEVPQFILEKSQSFLLEDKNLSTSPANIVVEYSGSLGFSARLRVSQALYNFLKIYGFEEGLTVNYREVALESFFIDSGGRMTKAPVLIQGIDFWPI